MPVFTPAIGPITQPEACLLGGAARAFLARLSDHDTVTEVDGVITGITLVAGGKMYEIEFEKGPEVVGWTYSEDTGFWEVDVNTLQFGSLDAATKRIIESWILTCKVVLYVMPKAGQGEAYGIETATGTTKASAKYGRISGHTGTFGQRAGTDNKSRQTIGFKATHDSVPLSVAESVDFDAFL